METGFRAMRLGGILFVLPFLFAINPTLILEGDFIDIVHDVFTAVVAVWMLASAFEGWLYGAGRLILPLRVVLGLAALGTLAPGMLTDLIGLGALIGVYAVSKFMRSSTPVSKTS